MSTTKGELVTETLEYGASEASAFRMTTFISDHDGRARVSLGHGGLEIREAVVNLWGVGAQVVWRSRPGGQVGFVFAAIVLEDCPNVTALFQPAGAPCKRRCGDRGGPSGRLM